MNVIPTSFFTIFLDFIFFYCHAWDVCVGWFHYDDRALFDAGDDRALTRAGDDRALESASDD